MNRFAFSVATLALLAFAAPSTSFAQEATSTSRNGGGLTGGFGYVWLQSNELVFDTNTGDRISHLIWDTQAPILSLGASGVFMEHWTIDANLDVGFSGKSHMADYDWLAPNVTSFAFDKWTDRSLHPDTRLDRYINLDIAAGRDFLITDTTVINLHGGFKYTNYKASSYGGSYVYSNGGLRNDIGTFANGLQVITYEQRLPGLFLGAEATVERDQWTFSGLFRGGVSINATDTDHHWRTGTRFEGAYGAVPFVSLGARIDYKVNDRAGFFLAGKFDNYFQSKATVRLYDIGTGAPTAAPLANGAGMDLRSVSLSAGFKLTF